jgi:hypothetical protein
VATSKIYQKRKYSLKDNNRLVGPIITSIPKPIAEAMNLKNGDSITWTYKDDLEVAVVFKK